MLTQYCNGGELTSVQKQAGGRYIAPDFLYNWFIQLAMALEYLHQNRIVHRDIKASNVFFFGAKLVKLGGAVQVDIGLTPRVESTRFQLVESTVLSSHWFQNINITSK